MAISREEILHVARLARLALTEDEIERLTAELDKILDAVYRELAAQSGVRSMVFVRKPSVSVPPEPFDWERLISEVTVAVAGFGG